MVEDMERGGFRVGDGEDIRDDHVAGSGVGGVDAEITWVEGTNIGSRELDGDEGGEANDSSRRECK